MRIKKRNSKEIMTNTRNIRGGIKNMGMTEQAKAARREYKREWNRKNPEKVREAQERYWNRKAAAQAQAQEEEQTEEAAVTTA